MQSQYPSSESKLENTLQNLSNLQETSEHSLDQKDSPSGRVLSSADLQQIDKALQLLQEHKIINSDTNTRVRRLKCEETCVTLIYKYPARAEDIANKFILLHQKNVLFLFPLQVLEKICEFDVDSIDKLITIFNKCFRDHIPVSFIRNQEQALLTFLNFARTSSLMIMVDHLQSAITQLSRHNIYDEKNLATVIKNPDKISYISQIFAKISDQDRCVRAKQNLLDKMVEFTYLPLLVTLIKRLQMQELKKIILSSDAMTFLTKIQNNELFKNFLLGLHKRLGVHSKIFTIFGSNTERGTRQHPLGSHDPLHIVRKFLG